MVEKKCVCQHCKKQIHFSEDELTRDKQIKCPHCNEKTDATSSVLKDEVRGIERLISIESAPAWFALVAGLIYATGFLIEFTFLNGMGIKESVTEVFKAKYIYVGLMYWQFPVCLSFILFGCLWKKRRCKQESNAVTIEHDPKEVDKEKSSDGEAANTYDPRTYRLKKHHENEDTNTRVYWATVLIFVLVLATFYLFILFSPPGFFQARQLPMVIFFGIVIFLLTIVRRLEEKCELLYQRHEDWRWLLKRFGHKNNSWTWWKRVRKFLAVSGLGVMIWIFTPGLGEMIWTFKPNNQISEFWSPFWEMLMTNKGYWYFIFLALAVYLLWSASKWYPIFSSHRRRLGFGCLAIMLPLPLTFLYVSVLAFAYHIYPYIPVERGGGDYTGENASILTFSTQFSNSIPSEILDTNLESKKVCILDETAKALFVTKLEATNAVGIKKEIAGWRANTSDSRPKQIFVIKSEAIVSVKSESW